MLTELHTHSTHSLGRKVYIEGIDTPEALLKQAKSLGIEAIAITDHDIFKGYLEAKKLEKKYGIFVIPGEEVTTNQGHLVAIGISDYVKPRLDLEETLDVIHEQGGIGIAAHPYDITKFGMADLAVKCDAVEVFNALNLERISNWKARRLVKRCKLPVTAGSDAHSADMLGTGLNDLKAEPDIDSIVKAIKKGRNKLITKYSPITAVRKWSVTRFKYGFKETQDYINKNYKGTKRSVSLKMLNTVKRSPGKIDYLYQGLAYFGIGSVIVYRAVREVLGI